MREFESELVSFFVAHIVGRQALESKEGYIVVITPAIFLLVEIHERPSEHAVSLLPRLLVPSAQLLQVTLDQNVLQRANFDLFITFARHRVHVRPIRRHLQGAL